MPSTLSRVPPPFSFGSIVRAGACFVAGAALVSVGCSGGDDETYFDENEGGEDGAGASGGAKGGRGGTGEGGDSSGGSDGVDSGGSGLAGSGGNVACNLADLESCGSGDDLCCPGPSGGECVPSSMQNCGACHAMCSPSTADACVDRACVCGSEPACSGDAPFCHEGHCAECRNDSDCADSPSGDQCAGGVCSACDPADNSGCSGAAPICSAELECEPCSAESPCDAPLVCDEDSGRCEGCLEHADCASPTAPICFRETGSASECRPCANEAECFERDPNRGECLSSGECAACDPGTHAGCTAQNPFCDTDLHCKECLDDDDCANGVCHEYGGELDDFKECWGCESASDCPNGKVCSSGNDCVDCTSDSDCAGNPAGAECVFDSCRQCDPAGNAGCSGEKDTCHNATFVCVECMNGSQCAPGQGCSNFNCTECSSDGECAGNAGGAQCVQVAPDNFECKPCDPLDDSGCAPPATCTAGFFCAD